MAQCVVPIGRRFQPGVSGNPGGRRSGLAKLVRRSTRNGRELVDFLIAVLRDDEASRRDRLEAAKVLLDRGFGRVPATLDPLLALEAAEAAKDQEQTALEPLRAFLDAVKVDPAAPPRVYDV